MCHLGEGALERGGRGRPRGRADRDVSRRVRARVGAPSLSAHDRNGARHLRGTARDLPDRLLQHRDEAVARPVGEGNGEVRPSLPLPRRRCRLSRASVHPLLLAGRRGAHRRARRQRRLRRAAAARGTGRHEPRPGPALAAHRRRQLDQRVRRDRRDGGLPPERAHERSEPSRGDALHPDPDAAARLPAPGARTPAAGASRPGARLPLSRHALHALPQRAPGPDRRAAGAFDSLSAAARLACAARAARRRRRAARRRRVESPPLLRGAAEISRADGWPFGDRALRRL